MLEQLRVWFWIIRNYPIYKYRCFLSRKDRERLNIMTSEQTVDYIIKNRCSVVRFGDGELQMVSHYLNKGEEDSFGVDTFQCYNKFLGSRLCNILINNDLCRWGGVICLPYQLKYSAISSIYGELFWDREWLKRQNFLSESCLDKLYGDTNFTRFYMGRKDILDYPSYITSLKRIWQDRTILIVEGELSRLGVGNDLFEGATNIQRVICPKTNAFDQYERILAKTQSLATKETLIILALGHTATVLAYDLSLSGFQALDLGHIDVEYEWYLMQAKTKVPVRNKYVNEVASGRIQEASTNERYNEQIVAKIL